MKAALSSQASWDLLYWDPGSQIPSWHSSLSSRQKEAWLKMFAWGTLPLPPACHRQCQSHSFQGEQPGKRQERSEWTGLASATPHDRQQWAALWTLLISYSGAMDGPGPGMLSEAHSPVVHGSGCQKGLCFAHPLCTIPWTDTNANGVKNQPHREHQF